MRSLSSAAGAAPKGNTVKRAIIRAALRLALACSAIAPAAAATTDPQIDADASRADASLAIDTLHSSLRAGGSFAEETLPPQGPNYDLLMLQAPALYDSNPIFAPTGYKGSWMFDPSAKLAVRQNFGFIQVSAFSSFEADRFTGFHGADGENWVSSLKTSLRLFHGAVRLYQEFQPVLRYSHTAAFKSDTNDVGGGVDIAMNAVPNTTADLDFNFMRRLLSAGNSDALTLRPTLGLVAGPWRLLMQPSYRVRFFDHAVGPSRTDQTVIVPAIVEYAPRWIEAGFGVQGDIQLSATYVRNISSVPGNRASQWIIGPTLEFGVSDSWKWNPFD
jgi:hypothetical protein